ncbi:DUF2264 domain-containing protein [Vibrio fluvialis]
MKKVIKATERPTIPYEHPDLALYWRTFCQHISKLLRGKNALSKNDAVIQQIFSDSSLSLKSKCEHFADYIAEAFAYYSVDNFTHAYYPGMPSQQGARMDAMEGCSRVLPTLAFWVARDPIEDSDPFYARKIDAINWLKHAFIAGTNPTHKGYWGALQDYDQRTCESADLALALWASKESAWDTFTQSEKDQIIAWFEQVNHVQVVDNNWHLFPVTVQLVIQSLTGREYVDMWRYERVKEFNVGEGWFRDGAKGNYDFYNAWGFHYSLYWIDQINPEFDRDYIRRNLCEFSSKFRYLFTPQGLPFFGRSACYRLAAAAPLIANLDVQDAMDTPLHSGEVKRALQTNFEYFIANGALKHGVPTQGLFASDARLTDNYSGPASSLWSLRALNIALYCGDRCGLWQAESAPLAVEKEDFSFRIPSIYAFVTGCQETKEVVVIFEQEYTQDQTPMSRRLETQSVLDKGKEILLGRAFRPKNNLLRKGVTCYSSKMSNFF